MFFFCFTAKATNYYLSSSGNDANNGTSATTPWKTIAKLNSFTGLVSGDAVLFKRGEIFYGSIIVNKSGSSGNPIVFGAYGTGANPIITGFRTVISWTNLGSNIWESTSAASTLLACNMVVINGVNTAMGRYPNTGYFTVNSFSGNTSLTSSSLNSAVTNWTGAQVVARKVAWVTDRSTVTSASGGTLTVTPGNASYNFANNWGFFIENDARTLDVQNEWYYNPSTKKIRIYSTTSPTNVQVSTIDTLVKIQSKSYITFDGVNFSGSNKAAFTISADHITIQNCTIDYSGQDAIWGAQNLATSTGFIFQNNTINHTNNNAINLRDNFTGALIQNNLIKNTGIQEGMMNYINTNGAGIGIAARGDNITIQNNEVDSSGFAGIGFFNTGDIVQYNFVNYCLLTMTDGGGIYTWVGSGNTPKTGQKVLHNIVLNSIGRNEGTTFSASGLTQAQGIYMDDWTGNVEIAYNTAANCGYSGLFLHNTTNINVHDNTFYNNGIGVTLASDDASNPIRNTTFKNNIVVSKLSSQYVAYFDSYTNDVSNFAGKSNIDSNYWARPIDDNVVFKTLQGIKNQNFNLEQLRMYSGFDISSNKSTKLIKDESDLRFEYNPSPHQLVVNLNKDYISMDGKVYHKKIILAPYSSVVLIK